MTPEIKASQIVNKYFNFIYLDLDYEQAKQCALIAVDEILEICVDSLGLTELDYWQDVKEEIQAL